MAHNSISSLDSSMQQANSRMDQSRFWLLLLMFLLLLFIVVVAAAAAAAAAVVGLTITHRQGQECA